MKSGRRRKRKRDFFKRQKALNGLPLLPIRTSEDKATSKAYEASTAEEEKPFALTNLALRVPKGSFVAIVGRVGSGKVLTSFVYPVNAMLKFTRARFFKH